MMPYKPYTIMTPPFDVTSGGIRVMYALYGWLLAKGQIVYLNTQIQGVPSIGIYPEIFHGNDLEATTVVRYLLNKPGVMAGYGIPGPTEFDPTDCIYSFSKLYVPEGLERDHILFLPVINLHVFRNYERTRTKTCYLVGKGINTHQHPSNSIELTRQFATDQTALADVLNDCQTLYCYDPISAMMECARLCGCKVVYLGGKPKEELENYEPGLDGIDFGDGTDFDPYEFRRHYEDMVTTFSKRLDQFIESTQHDPD